MIMVSPTPITVKQREGRGMASQLNELSMMIGGLIADVKHLTNEMREKHDQTTNEHRKVHEIVDALSVSQRGMASDLKEVKEDVQEMKPVIADVREKRSERTGQKRLIKAAYGIAAAGGALIVELYHQFFGTAPPHH